MSPRRFLNLEKPNAHTRAADSPMKIRSKNGAVTSTPLSGPIFPRPNSSTSMSTTTMLTTTRNSTRRTKRRERKIFRIVRARRA